MYALEREEEPYAALGNVSGGGRLLSQNSAYGGNLLHELVMWRGGGLRCLNTIPGGASILGIREIMYYMGGGRYM